MTVIDHLKDFLKCSIKFETITDMIIFNIQYYNSKSFQTHLQSEEERNRDYEDSVYKNDSIHFTCLKDPHIGMNFVY